VFVALMSRPVAWQTRDTLRRVWAAWPRNGWRITVRFAFCAGSLAEGGFAALRKEAHTHSDVVFLPGCTEGYLNLTNKTLTALRFYVDVFSHSHAYYMKVDDDTFVAWPRFIQNWSTRPEENVFFGSQRRSWKPYMLGGCGFGVSAPLARAIVAMPNLSMFPAEDASFGEWVRAVESTHVLVCRVYTSCWSNTKWFQPLLEVPDQVHQLDSKAIACLARIELSGRAPRLNECGNYAPARRRRSS